ncbi:MAG: polysaccharide pyruvyl transferase family protein [Bacteroidetes bacterium]|nr:polysaccharide pyruvyl transferase family protein [Bacteroidota bacterium]
MSSTNGLITIELRGVEFVNKGAELMLHAIVEQVRKFEHPVRLTMEASFKNPRAKLAALGIKPVWRPRLFGHRLEPVRRMMAKDAVRTWGLVPEEDVDVIMDASGYAFSDVWGASRARKRLGNDIRRWKAAGKRVIMLPQALGPFENPALQRVMRDIFDGADLVCPRDVTSLRHARAIGGSAPLRLTPDFTNLTAGIEPDKDFSRHVAIIPNRRMIEVPKGPSKSYFEVIEQTITEITRAGLTPFFLLHEMGRDVGLARKLNRMLATPLEVVHEPDPLKIKGIIGASYAVVTSRFHGLVSALAQGVPCLATSWSHKYQHLLEDYDYARGLIQDIQELPESVGRLLDPATQAADRAQLTRASAALKEQTKALWKEVAMIIFSPSGRSAAR